MADIIDIKEKVTKLLSEFGYTVETSDDWLIGFCIDKVENYIKSDCNLMTISDALIQTEIYLIAGEFLTIKKNTNQLNIEGINFDIMTKSISEGDTRVEFNTDGCSTDEQKFNLLIKHLLNRKSELISYRSIKW